MTKERKGFEVATEQIFIEDALTKIQSIDYDDMKALHNLFYVRTVHPIRMLAQVTYLSGDMMNRRKLIDRLQIGS